MKRIVLAPDSFKGSLSAAEVVESMARGVINVFPEAQVIKFPLSDGGEGLVDALVKSSQGRIFQEQVSGPLGQRVEAYWGMLGDGKTAVVEMAAATGLHLVPADQRNPFITTTFGVGELISRALDNKCSRIIVGNGGSSTNDGGAGMAQALGVKFLDQDGNSLPLGGYALTNLCRIDVSELDPRLQKTKVLVACDVNNPLIGPQGASYIYGPQKGATAAMVRQLDRALEHYAAIIWQDLGIDLQDIPGTGTGGGIGAGLLAFLKGQLMSGIDLVMDVLGLEKELANCDLLFTGEGKLDAQSLFGKVPIGVARRAAKYQVPVVVLAGNVADNKEIFYREGITGCFSIVNKPMTLQESMQNAAQLIELTTVDIMRLLK